MQMDSRQAEAPESVLLLMAGISVIRVTCPINGKTLAHRPTIITELVKAVVRQIKLLLEVAR